MMPTVDLLTIPEALERSTITPLDAAVAALAGVSKAALAGDCAAAEVAKDAALAALSASAAASATVVCAQPFSEASRRAKAETSHIGDLFATVCLEHSRARVVARRNGP